MLIDKEMMSSRHSGSSVTFSLFNGLKIEDRSDFSMTLFEAIKQQNMLEEMIQDKMLAIDCNVRQETLKEIQLLKTRSNTIGLNRQVTMENNTELFQVPEENEERRSQRRGCWVGP